MTTSAMEKGRSSNREMEGGEWRRVARVGMAEEMETRRSAVDKCAAKVEGGKGCRMISVRRV